MRSWGPCLIDSRCNERGQANTRIPFFMQQPSLNLQEIEIAETDDLDSVQKKLKKLAPEGKELINELTARVWKYKKQVQKRKS